MLEAKDPGGVVGGQITTSHEAANLAAVFCERRRAVRLWEIGHC